MSRVTVLLVIAFLALTFVYTSPTLARLASGNSIELVTVASTGEQALGESGYPFTGLPLIGNPVVAISPDGSLVAFVSYANNLVPTDTNSYEDIFVRSRSKLTTELISIDSKGNQPPKSNHGNAHGISADNRYVVFTQQSGGLVPNDDLIDDVYVHDLMTGNVERISESASGEPGNANSGHPAISGDGNVAIFLSRAQNLTGPATWGQLYAVNRAKGTVTRVSVGISGEAGDNYSLWGTLSHDGNLIAFSSVAGNLVLSDISKGSDVFLRDMSANTTTLISRRIDGFPQGGAINPYITPDGAYILFTSDATLTLDSSCPQLQVYVYSVVEDTIEIASLTEQGECPTGVQFGVYGCGISADGRYVFFSSTADNYVVGDTNSDFDIFMKDRVTGAVELISKGQDGSPANGDSERCGVSSDGATIAFVSEASNLIANDIGSFTDYFVYERLLPGEPTPTATATATPTFTPIVTITFTPIPTNTSTPTPTFTPIATNTSIPNPSPTATSSSTPAITQLYLPLIQRDALE